jgi:hypothetical protein
VFRCPQCGSTDAGPDESRSAYDFTYMECKACGHGGLVDSWERDGEWWVPSAKAAGCPRCSGEDAVAAWEALHANRVRTFVQESHFSVQITACVCGQHHAVVFTERIDWQGGEDDQTWLAVPVFPADLEALAAAGEDEVSGVLTRLAGDRRFLVRSYPARGSLTAWWRMSGFAIGPHD